MFFSAVRSVFVQKIWLVNVLSSTIHLLYLILIFSREIVGLEVKGFNQLRGAYAKESTFLISRFRNKVQYEGPDLVN